MDADSKRAAMDSFGEAADAYLASDAHRGGEDLDLLAEWCDGGSRALDVACGAGHAAGALADAGVSTVAADATPEMVRTATEQFSAAGVVADAERLPFRSASFDAAVCRIAAHHFPDPEAFVREVNRVLVSDGVFAFEDLAAPENEALADFCNRFEHLRDSTHMKAYSQSEWESRLQEGGFEVEASVVDRKPLDYRAWVERTDPSPDRRETLDELVRTPEAERAYDVEVEDGEVREFSNRKVLIRARKPA